MRRRARKVGVAVFTSTALTLGMTAAIAPAGAAPTKPGAPAKPAAIAMSLKAKVTWKAPANHGSPIDQYAVVASIKKVPKVTKIFKSTAVTQVIKGLKNATTYTFKVRAHNKVGWGPYSKPSAPVRIGAPVAPAAPAVIRGNATVRVNWKAPAGNGAPITGYVVTPIKGATALAPQVFNSTALAQNITGLTNGAAYKFKVAAKNSRGTGAASALSVAATPTATPALRMVDNPTIGEPILVDANGMTVYLYTVDGANTTSAVNGALRVAWPYVLWGGTPSVGPGLDASKIAAYVQPDGTNLLSYNGHLLYLWVNDHVPGDATGQNVNNFFVLDASGNQIGP
jgi:predicted lipoprotein with Yx(FWY)xxD motif